MVSYYSTSGTQFQILHRELNGLAPCYISEQLNPNCTMSAETVVLTVPMSILVPELSFPISAVTSVVSINVSENVSYLTFHWVVAFFFLSLFV